MRESDPLPPNADGRPDGRDSGAADDPERPPVCPRPAEPTALPAPAADVGAATTPELPGPVPGAPAPGEDDGPGAGGVDCAAVVGPSVDAAVVSTD
ncbi:hypothetical protein RU01_12170, partial [Rhodococcus sp. MEB064]